MEFLANYGLFLAKFITILVGLLFAIIVLLLSIARSKAPRGELVITSLNEKYQSIKNDLQRETLTKPELKQWQKNQKKAQKQQKASQKEAEALQPRVFVLHFNGDIRAAAVEDLRETVSAILEIALNKDEVMVVLESPGGVVHGYGLAASQLDRIRQRLPLTVAIDKVAASGGYMMAAVANQIIAAPFALVGSIGVIGQLPNFNRFLDKHNIDYEMQTAGEFKRTLTLFGKNTDEGRQKFQQEIDETHELFKQYIVKHRPQVDIAKVATGEHWHGSQAIELNLIDKIQTSDDFILEKIKTANVFELSYVHKPKLSEKIVSNVSLTFEKILLKLMQPFSQLWR